MQVDPEDQKPQAGDNVEKKSETEEMEVKLWWEILTRCFMILHMP